MISVQHNAKSENVSSYQENCTVKQDRNHCGWVVGIPTCILEFPDIKLMPENVVTIFLSTHCNSFHGLATLCSCCIKTIFK